MTEQTKLDQFTNQLAAVATLVPRDHKKVGKIAQAIYTRQVVTIVGVKTTTSRFLPVSHEGYSNETYVDKVELWGKTRAEFIARKLKGVERRAHMALFREKVETYLRNNGGGQQGWQTFFEEKFGKACTIPDSLCVACWNCSLFGGMEAGKGATFSRIRYFDTFSVEDAAECIQSDDSPEGMAIGNTVGEDLSVERSEASFHRYEYVKAETRFPFITIIESPTLLDVAGYLAAVKLADQHGYGKYSANHGKFKTEFLAVSTGYPLFSVLDLLTWLENGELTNPKEKLHFETAVNNPVTLFGEEIDEIRSKLDGQFRAYMEALTKQ
ncbi:CRISPR-associated protein Csc2 [Spirochaeta thermophila DSM 6578]|uniref:CRISPR-associated protein Csc2 n=1 Tax=Winmispira thermophila (strain ATCC 700085 / DSM 6578 / Z-1203) TaxID=869211 RepID=G0GAK7_WINT7|nr:type I-D CRISPR-associated protein Cas7/Csc2 [Spirochaeta thermophila]AEJ60972.1 CRISPR-associated protein Csc2 [Spirochaeta thermophila DSM 6578]